MTICAAPTPFKPGARDLKFVMTRAGGLEGSLMNFGSRGWSTYSNTPFDLRVTGPKIWLVKRNINQTGGAGHSVHLSNLCTEILEVTHAQETAVFANRDDSAVDQLIAALHLVLVPAPLATIRLHGHSRVLLCHSRRFPLP